MRRPLTEHEARRDRTLRAWAMSLAEGRTLAKAIRGFSRYPCPGTGMGGCYCGHATHADHHTNHASVDDAHARIRL